MHTIILESFYSAFFLSQPQMSSSVAYTPLFSTSLFLAKSPNVKIPTTLLFFIKYN